MRLNQDGYYRNRHSCFLLEYHLVLITKYRHPVITGAVKDYLYEYTKEYFKAQNLFLHEINGESDHVHILFDAPPQINLATFVNAFKSASSRMIRSEFAVELKPYYWKPYFWSLSYFVAGVSERSFEATKRYIESQKGE